MHILDDGTPLWSFEDQETILGNGVAVAHRHGTDLEELCVVSPRFMCSCSCVGVVDIYGPICATSCWYRHHTSVAVSALKL